MKLKLRKKQLNQKKESSLPVLWKGKSITVSAFGRSYSFYPGRLAVLIVAALLVLVIAIQLLTIPSRRTRILEMDFSTGGVYTMQAFQQDLLMYNKQNIRVVNRKGETKWSVSSPMSLPVVETAGSYVLAADLGGNNAAALYKKGEKIRDFHLGKDIISAKVSKKGLCVFATAADGYKGKVTVLDKKGREVFGWNSGDGYIMDVAVSENGRYLAVAQMLSGGEQADSRIQFIDLFQKKVVRTADRPGCLVGELRFAGGKLIAVSDMDFCGFSSGGRLLYSVSFAGRKPGKYDISGGELLAFVTSDNRGNAVLEIYNTRGKLKGRYQADSHISALSVHKDMIVVASQRNISRISSGGKKRRTVVSDHDVKSLGIFGNGKTVLSAGVSRAEIMWFR